MRKRHGKLNPTAAFEVAHPRMAIQIVVDNSGDSRFEFDPSDRTAVAEATARFKELTALGYTAVERTAPGRARKVTEFGPTATEVLFMPRWVGG